MALGGEARCKESSASVSAHVRTYHGTYTCTLGRTLYIQFIGAPVIFCVPLPFPRPVCLVVRGHLRPHVCPSCPPLRPQNRHKMSRRYAAAPPNPSSSSGGAALTLTALVVEVGGANTRIGFAGDDVPKASFPTVSGCRRAEGNRGGSSSGGSSSSGGGGGSSSSSSDSGSGGGGDGGGHRGAVTESPQEVTGARGDSGGDSHAAGSSSKNGSEDEYFVGSNGLEVRRSACASLLPVSMFLSHVAVCICFSLFIMPLLVAPSLATFVGRLLAGGSRGCPRCQPAQSGSRRQLGAVGTSLGARLGDAAGLGHQEAPHTDGRAVFQHQVATRETVRGPCLSLLGSCLTMTPSQ